MALSNTTRVKPTAGTTARPKTAAVKPKTVVPEGKVVLGAGLSNGEGAEGESLEQRHNRVVTELRTQAINIINKKAQADAALTALVTGCTTLADLMSVVAEKIAPFTAKAVVTDRDAKAFNPAYKQAKALQKHMEPIALNSSAYISQRDQAAKEAADAKAELEKVQAEAKAAVEKAPTDAKAAADKEVASIKADLERKAAEEAKERNRLVEQLTAKLLEKDEQSKKAADDERTLRARIADLEAFRDDQLKRKQMEALEQKAAEDAALQKSRVEERAAEMVALQSNLPPATPGHRFQNFAPAPTGFRDRSNSMVIPATPTHPQGFFSHVPPATPGIQEAPTDFKTTFAKAFSPECNKLLQYMQEHITEEKMEEARCEFLKRYTNMTDTSSTTAGILTAMRSQFASLSFPEITEAKSPEQRHKMLQRFGNQEACYRFIKQAYKQNGQHYLSGNNSAAYSAEFESLRKQAKPAGVAQTPAVSGRPGTVADSVARPPRPASLNGGTVAKPVMIPSTALRRV